MEKKKHPLKNVSKEAFRLFHGKQSITEFILLFPEVSQSLSGVIIESGAAWTFSMVSRESLEKGGEREEKKWKEKRGGGREERLPLFFQTMPLSSGISPLADDEGRADVISDKFLIAFQVGTTGPACVSRPFHSRDTVHREESKVSVEIRCFASP